MAAAVAFQGSLITLWLEFGLFVHSLFSYIVEFVSHRSKVCLKTMVSDSGSRAYLREIVARYQRGLGVQL